MISNLRLNNTNMFLNFSKRELALFKKLDTPIKIQKFLDKIPFNFELNKKDTIKSPLRVLRENNAHCIEGALLSAYILSLHGYKPYLLHLKTKKNDKDHVITVFKIKNHFGAISKTNHCVLGYRDPIYKNLRELVMSYFHEYFLDSGEKTLRAYSELLDLNIFDDQWPIADTDLWGIDQELDNIKHYKILNKDQIKELSKADKFQIESTKIERHKKQLFT